MDEYDLDNNETKTGNTLYTRTIIPNHQRQIEQKQVHG